MAHPNIEERRLLIIIIIIIIIIKALVHYPRHLKLIKDLPLGLGEKERLLVQTFFDLYKVVEHDP